MLIQPILPVTNRFKKDVLFLLILSYLANIIFVSAYEDSLSIGISFFHYFLDSEYHILYEKSIKILVF